MINSEKNLIAAMTNPSAAVSAAVSQLEGGILLLGAAGKMGPTLAELLVRAGAPRVIAVSRFSDPVTEAYLRKIGVETVRADLLAASSLSELPTAPYVYSLAGFKFGAANDVEAMWATNALLPCRVVEKFRDSRIVHVSSGNVYPFSDVTGAGCSEDTPPDPVGEYAQSRLGGERLAAAAAAASGAKLFIARLFYATEQRYGILHDIGSKVRRGEAIDLSMGYVNQIWQGDVNAYLARSFPLCSSPAATLNMAGPAVLSVRELALKLGSRLGVEPVFTGDEHDTALLGDATRLRSILGPPPTPIDDIICWVADWIQCGGRSLGKPTKYESRSGTF